MTNRIPRHMRRRFACWGKSKIRSMELARKAAAAASRRTGDDIQAYRCKHCGGAHVGHVPGTLRRSTEDVGRIFA